MYKFRADLSNEEKSELDRLSRINFENYTEADIREEYIVPIMNMLGYRKDKDFSISREESFNLNNAFLSVGSKKIRLDYIFSIRKKYFWLIDAKSGKKNIDIQNEDICQAYFYSIHPEINCMYFGVCNGWYFNLYERDSLDNNFTPIVSIKSSEITEKFLQLDKYLGTSQILPTLKEKLLGQIEKVLSAEIVEERLDDFKDRVSNSISNIRPQVRENWRAVNRNIFESRRDIFLSKLDVWQIVDTMFNGSKTFKEIHETSEMVFKSKEFQSGGIKQYLLLNRLFLNKLQPVTYWYYVNLIYFLIYLKKNGVTYLRFSFNGASETSIDELLNYWINQVYSKFENRKDIRAFGIYEAELKRYLKYESILNSKRREEINALLNEERYYQEEEMLVSYASCQARTMILLLEKKATILLGKFIDKYFKSESDTFKEFHVVEEINVIKANNLKVLEKSMEKYTRILEELGDSWGDLSWIEETLISFDPLISAISCMLTQNNEIIGILNEDTIKNISLVCSLDISTFTKELCENNQIQYTFTDKKIKKELHEEFFSFELSTTKLINKLSNLSRT